MLMYYALVLFPYFETGYSLRNICSAALDYIHEELIGLRKVGIIYHIRARFAGRIERFVMLYERKVV